MTGKKNRPSLSAMEEFDLEAKIQQATQDGISTINKEQDGIQKLKKGERDTVTLLNKKEAFKDQYLIEKKKRPLGRPKKNPYSEEKKLTIRMPEALHRQLRFASADTGKPMVEIAVEALIQYLIEYENE